MSAQIRSIILYGNNGQTRTISLRLNNVNIITGKSRTGKTALLDIIDYCLGRGTCNVPEGVIRRAVSWYALLLQLPDSQFFVARKNPGPNAATSPDVVIEAGQRLSVPTLEALIPNITLAGLSEALSRLMGIGPNENVPPPNQSRLPLRATLDHAKFLIFQGQSEIANREFLFHRQGEQFIPQAIKDTLPYFIGAVPDTTLMLRAQLKEAKQELARLHRQRGEAQRIAGDGMARANSLLAEARDVGLVAQSAQRDARENLKSILTATLQADRTEAIGSSYGGELERLRNALAGLRRRYQELNESINAATEFNGTQTVFESVVEKQRARLEVIGLMPPNAGESQRHCPVCHSELEFPIPGTADLQAALHNLRTELQGIGDRRPRVDEHINDLRSELQKVRGGMNDTKKQIDTIEEQSRQDKLASDWDRRRMHVVGRVSLYLESVPDTHLDEGLESRLIRLEQEIERIEGELSSESIRDSVESALNRIGYWMTEGAKALRLEYQPNPYRLDLGKLTVISDTDARPVRMNQMGSAENWLGCHLIAHVAIHRWFSMKKRPVPRFLFIDQPTSAYYPPDDPTQGTDEDRAAVSRMYRWLIDSVQRSRSKFQMLIVDHADLQGDWFQSCVIEKWRGEDALIPESWLG